MGWFLLLILLLILLGGGPHVVYLVPVSERDLERQRRVAAIVALAMLGAGAFLALALVAPAWLWGMTWQGAALWFGLAHWQQVMVAGYSTLAILAVLVLAGAMFAVMDKRNQEGRTE